MKEDVKLLADREWRAWATNKMAVGNFSIADIFRYAFNQGFNTVTIRTPDEKEITWYFTNDDPKWASAMAHEITSLRKRVKILESQNNATNS